MKARAPPPPHVPLPAPRHIFRNAVPDGGGTSDMDAKENLLRPTVDLQLTLPQGHPTAVTEDGRWEGNPSHSSWNDVYEGEQNEIMCWPWPDKQHETRLLPVLVAVPWGLVKGPIPSLSTSFSRDSCQTKAVCQSSLPLMRFSLLGQKIRDASLLQNDKVVF